MMGLFSVENGNKALHQKITESAKYSGMLQIYPLVRAHLLSLLRADGIRLKLPYELELPEDEMGTEDSVTLHHGVANVASQGKQKRKSKRKM